jgi:predicted MFS family arabinose efflux permease
MSSSETAPSLYSAAIPWRVAPPLVSTALIMIGSGFLGTLLPLRFSAMGLSDGLIGLLATAEAFGFLAGCLYAHKVIAPVGLERAYATFASLKSVAILGLYFADGVPLLAVLRFLIGVNAAGLSIIVESWLNALVPNEQRGRVLTIYVLVYGLFFGVGQLLSQGLNVRGPTLLLVAGIATTLALVPMVAIDVRAPVLPRRVTLEIIKALRTSPVSVTACLLNGLILTAFTTVGPLFSVRIGFDQREVVILMACVSLGGLFLQWPIGYLSDKIDRLHALIGLGLGILAVRVARASVRHLRRPRRKSLCGGGGACQRPRGFRRLRCAEFYAVIHMGFGLSCRPHRGDLCHPTRVTERLLYLRDDSDACLYTVCPVAVVPPQSRSHRRIARGFFDLPADLTGNICLAALSSGRIQAAADARRGRRSG